MAARPDLQTNLKNMELACLNGKAFKYTRPAKRVTRTESYIRRVIRYLWKRPGSHRQKDICIACGIPLGSTCQVFSDKRFNKVEQGRIIMAPDYSPPEDLRPKFYYQEEIYDMLRKVQPMRVAEVAKGLGVAYPTAKKELDSGLFFASSDGYWLPMKEEEANLYEQA